MKAHRYTDKKKAEVVSFVHAYDNQHGRGGKAAARKKYNINPITIATWVERAREIDPRDQGAPATLRSGKKGVTPLEGALPTVSAKRGGRKQVETTADRLKRMLNIRETIDALQSEFDELKTAI